jgi:hypothetical protein
MKKTQIDYNWNELIGKSNYHFDRTRIDTDKDCVEYLGNISPTWVELISKIVKESTPITWWSKGRGADKHSIADDDLSGELVLSNMLWTIPVELQEIVDQFGLENCMARIHVQLLGQIWSLHIDNLGHHMPENPDSVTRINIQLTDWQLGQTMDYGNYSYKQWNSGDVITFDWNNMPHCTANAGYHPRVTLQITGGKTAKTEDMLAWLATTNKN